MKFLKVYTDGACSGNPGPGGYAAIIIDGTGVEQVLSGSEKATTNNRMEMFAMIESLKAVRKLIEGEKEYHIDYFVDSQYLLKGINEWLEGWKKKNWKSSTGHIKNRELWEEIDELIQGLKINWHWVKGHAGNKYNEKVDQIAVKEVEKEKSKGLTR